MRRLLLVGVAVLAVASAANAMMLQTSNGTESISLAELGATNMALVTFPVMISGGENVDAATVNISLSQGNIVGIERKAGTIFAGSSNTPDDPYIFDDSNGSGTTDGVYSDFGNSPGVYVPATGVLAILTLDLTGVSGDVLVNMFGDNGNTMLQPGSVELNNVLTITPEPAALVLLALGGLFIRRRHA